MPSLPWSALISWRTVCADARVEVGERLVEEQDAGVDRERAAKRHPLTLAAREPGHRPLAQPLEAEQGQDLLDPPAPARRAATPRRRSP